MRARDSENDPDHRRIEILARLLADRDAGRLAPLTEYMASFPGLEEQVAREFLLVRDATAAGQGSSAAVSPPTAPLGADDGPRRVGPYELVRELGRGGQGAVWLARDPRMGRELALKIVPRTPLLGEVSRRFQREARIASQLDHCGLCPVYDVGTDETLAWIAMRYVPGETLAELLAKRDGEPVRGDDLAATVLLLERLARALHATHEAGIVHRDVKPGNVIVTPAGEPVLLDFGIARDDDEGAPLTLTGDALGTPVYMSPEQLSGQSADPRMDVWSLGATAYELLSGERAFDALTREGVIEAVMRREPEPLSRLNRSVSRDLEVVISTALTKEVDRRYTSALDLADDLARVREGRPIRARAAGPLERLLRWAKRNPGIAASLAAVFLVLVAGLTISTSLLSETRTALEANATLMDEVTQLADAKVAGDLLAEEGTLWPALPENAPAMDRWLRRARALESRIEMHRRALENVDQRLASEVTAEFAGSADTETNAWMREQLTQIIAAIEQLLEVLPGMEARHRLAASLHEVTVADRRADWEAAAERVANDPRFDGLELAPQLGLIPLGPDPESGLEEFAHLLSGTPPGREAGTGRFALREESAVVLVLIPGGEATIGCDPPGPGRPVGAPLVDPRARAKDGPVYRLRLEPFFISKYEMTAGQYERQTGEISSFYNTHPELASIQPLESVDSLRLTEVLGQLGLTLPTEAQWERAARGGTTTIWYTGNDPESLIGHVNLSDEGCRDDGGPARWEYVPWLDDGYTATAPVGSFRPNPYGLHDVHGNVCEWTANPWLTFEEDPPRGGDGASAFMHLGMRGARGGSFAKPDFYARSGHRDGLPAHLFPPDVGVRPGRALDPAP